MADGNRYRDLRAVKPGLPAHQFGRGVLLRSHGWMPAYPHRHVRRLNCGRAQLSGLRVLWQRCHLSVMRTFRIVCTRFRLLVSFDIV